MMRFLPVVVAVLASLDVFAQQFSLEERTKDYSKLFRLSRAKVRTIDSRTYLDVVSPFVVASDAIVLDPDDKTAATEPAPVMDVEVGKKDGRSVWLRLKVLKPGEEEKILEAPDFSQLETLLSAHGVSTQMCRDQKVCTKWCTTGNVRWCCEKKCQ